MKTYQQLASRTLTNAPVVPLSDLENMLAWDALGLAGEAGEVADYIKKVVYHRHELDREKLKLELGDVLWYLTGIATHAGLTLEEIQEANIKKLETRYKEGFTVEESKARVDLDKSPVDYISKEELAAEIIDIVINKFHISNHESVLVADSHHMYTWVMDINDNKFVQIWKRREYGFGLFDDTLFASGWHPSRKRL
jgi:NTP pyrophosphatase (non-canonical NTP hydrolase)